MIMFNIKLNIKHFNHNLSMVHINKHRKFMRIWRLVIQLTRGMCVCVCVCVCAHVHKVLSLPI